MQEIERKFLINSKFWKPIGKGVKLEQGYISNDPERIVRVRIADDQAFLTIKGKTKGIVRTELEYEIPIVEAEVLMKMSLNTPIRKKRFKEKFGGLTWEIDVFEEDNQGLILAEVELNSVNQRVELPDWIGIEVSHDYRYFNSWLSQNPFTKW